jgi:hypothetical protein
MDRQIPNISDRDRNVRCPNMMKLVIGFVLRLCLISVGEAGSGGYAWSSYSYSGARSYHTGRFGAHGGRWGWSSYAGSYPGVGIAGAPLHGIVCSRGLIRDLPVERQKRYIDGATLGHPGYRCLNFN